MKKPVQDSTVSLMSSLEWVQRNHTFFSFISSISLVNACETAQKTACVSVCTCRTLSLSEKGALLHFIPVAVWALQQRFHLWFHLIQSSPASRWCCALLGIFSLDNLTFEQLSRASALRSVCQLLSAKLSPFICRYLATVCK